MAGLIHPLAHIGPDAVIGDGSRVWQFASVIRGAVLGTDCNIASCAIVDGAELGEGCLVGHGASVHPGARLGDKVFVGPGAVLCNDMWPRADKAGFCLEAFKAGLVSVRIEDGASIGANAVILPGITVGAGAMVAAGAVVTRNVPPGYVWHRIGNHPAPIGEAPKSRMRAAAC